jgi:arginyl-tRNA synthetase
MKKTLETLISKALTTLQANGILDNTLNPTIHVERTRDSSHGDFATNIALVLAKSAKTNPRQLAQQLIEAMPANDIVSKIELAGAGFINFFIDANAHFLLDLDIQVNDDGLVRGFDFDSR